MAELLIGVDLGTSGTKTALYDAGGEPLATATVAARLSWGGPGELEQDPEFFVSSTLETIAACVAEAGAGPGDVAAIGITGQMAGTMGIDSDWRPSTPYDSWLDTRCAPDVAALEDEVGEELVRLAGCPAMVNHAPKIRWRRRERPDEFEATAAWVPPSSFVSGRLAGLAAEDAFVDRSYLHFTGLAEARDGRWAEPLAAAVGVPLEKLPEIVEPATVIGELSAEAAAATGLRAGVPIAAGLGDTAAGVLGAGVVRPGQLLDTAGTAAVFAISTAEHRPDLEARTLIVMRGALPGQWIGLSYMAGGGLFDWMAALFGDEGEDGGETDYEAFGYAAERAAAGSRGLLFVPHLDGRVLPSEPAMRGAWIGLDRDHRRDDLTRSVLESVGLEYALYLRLMRALHPEIDPADVRVIGGGARSEAWCSIKASVLGLPFVRLHREEFSCWGAALVAGAACGLIDDLAAAAERGSEARDRFEPDPGDAPVYAELTDAYEEAVAAVGGLARRHRPIANGAESIGAPA